MIINKLRQKGLARHAKGVQGISAGSLQLLKHRDNIQMKLPHRANPHSCATIDMDM
jgi:hypothetical protein